MMLFADDWEKWESDFRDKIWGWSLGEEFNEEFESLLNRAKDLAGINDEEDY